MRKPIEILLIIANRYCRRNARFPLHSSPHTKFQKCAARVLIRPGVWGIQNRNLITQYLKIFVSFRNSGLPGETEHFPILCLEVFKTFLFSVSILWRVAPVSLNFPFIHFKGAMSQEKVFGHVRVECSVYYWSYIRYSDYYNLRQQAHHTSHITP